MQQERDNHQLPVAHQISEEAKEDDRDAESSQALAGDDAQFGLRKAELSSPIGQDIPADREAHARRDQGKEAGPEEDLFIGGVVHRMTSHSAKGLCHRCPPWAGKRRKVGTVVTSRHSEVKQLPGEKRWLRACEPVPRVKSSSR